MSDLNVRQKLLKVQSKLKAPKGQYNNFGRYSYRSAEDILEAVKPLLVENELLMTIADKPIVIQNRVYIEATITIMDIETGEAISTTGYAQEPDSIKGMAPAQITGASSSYARKYALNGMFIIDDNKDPDTEEYKTESERKAEKEEEEKGKEQARKMEKKAKKLQELNKLRESKGVSAENMRGYINNIVGKETSQDMTFEEIDKAIEWLENAEV